MSRRKFVILAQVATLGCIALYLLVYHGPSFGSQSLHSLDLDVHISQDGTILGRQNLTDYVRAILDPTTATHSGLAMFGCPSLDSNRYKHLQQQDSFASNSSQPPPLRYFFALNLRNCLPLLPRLLGSVLEAIRFLGPASCALSIVEGNSPDGTAEVLAALEPHLRQLPGLRTHFALDVALDPLAEGSDRFATLAALRNMALAPLLAAAATADSPDDATVLFVNDVAACPDDLLELAHQRARHSADMACAMDWTGSSPPVFYDSYVARALNGDLFFDIAVAPPAGGRQHGGASWARAAELLWNEPRSRARLERHRPFQVFACWNGAVAFGARPVVAREVAFRGAREAERGECRAGEPGLFCKDLWLRGYGRIMVVPAVNLGYTVEEGERVKRAKGFAASWAAESDQGPKIEWLPPPDMVKCMPRFEDQSWRPWNETLV